MSMYKYSERTGLLGGVSFNSSVENGEYKMFKKHYPEYPEHVLVFWFPNGFYMTPEQLDYFFKRLDTYLGGGIRLRSLTMFTGAFNEITFWFTLEKIGTWWQRIYAKVFRVDMSNYAREFAEQLAMEFTENLDVKVEVRVSRYNRRRNNNEH